jgi:hypothetical protein
MIDGLTSNTFGRRGHSIPIHHFEGDGNIYSAKAPLTLKLPVGANETQTMLWSWTYVAGPINRNTAPLSSTFAHPWVSSAARAADSFAVPKIHIITPATADLAHSAP